MITEITLFNTVKNTSLTLNQDIGSTILLESCDWGVVSSNRVTYKYTNQVGVQVTNVTLETRDISIIGWITLQTEKELESLAKRLNVFINPKEAMKLQYQEYELKFFPTSSIRWGTTIQDNNDVMRKFKIDGFAADPLFRTINDDRLLAGVVEPLFYFPLTIPSKEYPDLGVIFGIRREYIIMSVPNRGDVVTGFRIEFIASKGTVTNPQLINTETQEYIKVNKKMEKGERIVINTEDGEKSIMGYASEGDTVGSNYYRYRDLKSTWLQLQSGDNLYKYDADENVGNLEIRIYHSNRYLEVE